MKYWTIELSSVETQEIVKWLNVVSFTRRIFIGGSKTLYFFAIDYYERFTLARAINTVSQNMVFNGSTIGVEKDLLVKYFTHVLTTSPGTRSSIRIGTDSTDANSPLEVWVDGTSCKIHRRRLLRYELTFTHRLTSPKEFCKHIINFCLLACPCTATLVSKNGCVYLSISAENELCTFKNLFHLSTTDAEPMQPAIRSCSLSLRNMRTIHQAIMRKESVAISLSSNMLGFMLDTHTVAIVADEGNDLWYKDIDPSNILQTNTREPQLVI